MQIKFLQTLIIFIVLMMCSITVNAQVEYRWLAAGSFHNFYSNFGSEIEQGFITEQQGGWQWPAIYPNQDAQAMKGFWLGADNFTDENGVNYPKRVVHVGPRVLGADEFFPVEFKTISKFPAPEVVVDGLVSFDKNVENDEIDPNMEEDRKIVTTVNSLLGITVQRTIRQFSQQYHDNYHVIEYIFTNTGNTDADEDIELPNQTVEGFIPFFLNRMAPVRDSRFYVGNATGWGQNTMNDRRGDGQVAGEAETFRAQFAWHGRFPDFRDHDNIGAPIFAPPATGRYLAEDDTTGRLASYHFVGTVTLHADASVSDESDDPGQPFTMAEEHNDDDRFFQNNAFDPVAMQSEYSLMTKGRNTTRHAFRVEPSGYSGFIEPTGDPKLSNNLGGFGYTYAYGPYTLGPGESVRIVIAEASAGISRELANETGAMFKQGGLTAKEKNEIVFQSRDSLFQTFNRAIANFDSDFSIPSPPEPPSSLTINSAGDGVELMWDYGDTSGLDGFQIYRASGRVDSTYRLLFETGPNEFSFVDGEAVRNENPALVELPIPIRGRDYFYYVVAKAATNNNDNTGLTPTGSPLISNRYFSQSYAPARLLRKPGEAMAEIRVVPNPYNPNINDQYLLDQSGRDRIAFFEIPGICTIEIYTELGELVKTIEHENGSGDEFWDLRTDFRQRVVSGIYIARIINKDPNDDNFGETAIRKIVIIL
ncbi:MAG: T9SS type A sorting domain-containing protein [Balneola sp.]